MTIESGSIVMYTFGEWTAVYLNGKLVRVGDSYLADEWLHNYVGVVDVDDNAFLRGGDGREGVAATLDDLHAYVAERTKREERVAALRAEARRIQAEADELERPR